MRVRCPILTTRNCVLPGCSRGARRGAVEERQDRQKKIAIGVVDDTRTTVESPEMVAERSAGRSIRFRPSGWSSARTGLWPRRSVAPHRLLHCVSLVLGAKSCDGNWVSRSLRARGRSALRIRGRIADLASDVAAVIDQLGGERTILFGHDRGRLKMRGRTDPRWHSIERSATHI